MLMRVAFLVLLLIGVAIGVAYPWTIRNLAGHEIGTWRVQEAATGFQPVNAKLGSTDAPVMAYLDVAAVMPVGPFQGQSILTITVSRHDRTVLARTLDFSDAETLETSPQTAQQRRRVPAGTISEVEQGDYTFTIGPGDAEGIDIRSVDLVLLGGIGGYDERAQPVGFSIMAIGFIGFVLSLRRGRGSSGDDQPPPKPRWGRGATGET